MTTSVFYVGNSAIARVDSLRDEDGNYVNDATVTLESFTNEAGGGAVGGVTTPLTLSYVAGTNGRYEAALSHSLAVTPGEWYVGVFRAVTSGGLRGQWTERVRAQTRSA